MTSEPRVWHALPRTTSLNFDTDGRICLVCTVCRVPEHYHGYTGRMLAEVFFGHAAKHAACTPKVDNVGDAVPLPALPQQQPKAPRDKGRHVSPNKQQPLF